MVASLSLPEETVVLTARSVQGATALTQVLARAPACVLTPRPRGETAWACLGSLGGGLVAGDALSYRVDVGSGARLLLSTQASTKIYKGTPQTSASQTLSASVASDALLAVLPDPITCFADARYRQTQTFRVHPNGSLLYLDWLTSGRAARDERWAFTRYESTTRVLRNDRLTFWDATRLTHDDDTRPLAERMGRFDVMGMLLCQGPLVESLGNASIERAKALPLTRRADIAWTASRTAQGATLVRFAATQVSLAQALVQELLEPCAQLLGGSPFERRGF